MNSSPSTTAATTAMADTPMPMPAFAPVERPPPPPPEDVFAELPGEVTGAEDGELVEPDDVVEDVVEDVV